MRVDAGERADRVRPVRPGIAAIRVQPAERAAHAGGVALRPADVAGRIRAAPVVVGHALAVGRRRAGEAVRAGVFEAAAERPLSGRARAAGARVPRVLVAAFDRGRARRRSALPRRHLHDAADGVAAEQRALRPAHDFHLRDVAERQQREVEAAAEGVRADAVHEHQRVVRLAAAREHRRQRAASAAARDGHARQRAQRVGHRLELARLDLVARDDRRCGGRLGERPRHLRGRDDHGFGDGRDVERDRQILAGVIGQAHDRRIGDEAGRFRDHPVRGVGRGRQIEAAVACRDHLLRPERAVNEHGGAGNGPAIRIDDAPLHAGGVHAADAGAEDEREYAERGDG